MYREKMFGISLYRSGANHVKQVRDKDQGRGKGFRQMCVSFKPAAIKLLSPLVYASLLYLAA
jgi:hypothetical protein